MIEMNQEKVAALDLWQSMNKEKPLEALFMSYISQDPNMRAGISDMHKQIQGDKIKVRENDKLGKLLTEKPEMIKYWLKTNSKNTQTNKLILDNFGPAEKLEQFLLESCELPVLYKMQKLGEEMCKDAKAKNPKTVIESIKEMLVALVALFTSNDKEVKEALKPLNEAMLRISNNQRSR